MAAMGSRARSNRSQRRWVSVGLLLATLVALAIVGRLMSETVPSLRIQRLLAHTLPIRGPRPKLDWPADGEAAVEIEGLGSLGRSGPSTPLPIASVAKVMTAYLTLRRFPLAAGSEGFELRVSAAEVADERRRAGLGESVVPVVAGERLSERQALQALLIPSANNVAEMLADHDAGSAGAFVERMNATARTLGMVSTAYTDPSGYDASTVSTPIDQLKLAAVAMRDPAFAAIVDESSVELPVAGEVDNYNALAGHDGYVGIKTGSDGAAGGCLLFAKRVTVDGRRFTILGAVLGQREESYVPAALESARDLGDSAAVALRSGTVLPAGAGVLVASGVDGHRTSIVTESALREIGWGGLRVPVTVSVSHVPTRLTAGQQVATVSVGGVAAASSRAISARVLSAPSLSWRLRHLL